MCPRRSLASCRFELASAMKKGSNSWPARWLICMDACQEAAEELTDIKPILICIDLREYRSLCRSDNQATNLEEDSIECGHISGAAGRLCCMQGTLRVRRSSCLHEAGRRGGKGVPEKVDCGVDPPHAHFVLDAPSWCGPVLARAQEQLWCTRKNMAISCLGETASTTGKTVVEGTHPQGQIQLNSNVGAGDHFRGARV